MKLNKQEKPMKSLVRMLSDLNDQLKPACYVHHS